MSIGPTSGSGRTIPPPPVTVPTDQEIGRNNQEVGVGSEQPRIDPTPPALPPATAKPAQPGGRTAPQNLRPPSNGVNLKGGGTPAGPATSLATMDRGVGEVVDRVRVDASAAAAVGGVTGAFIGTLDGATDPTLDASLYRGLDGMYAHPERLGGLQGSFDLLSGGPSDPGLDGLLWGILGNTYDHPDRANAAGPTMDLFSDAVYRRFSDFL